MPRAGTGKVFIRGDVKLLQRYYDAIQSDSQPDITRSQSEVVEKCLRTLACAEAFDLVLSLVRRGRNGNPTALKLKQILEQKCERANVIKLEERYRNHVAYLAKVWSPDVLKYYGSDDQELSHGKARVLYRCAQMYKDFREFVRHHNVFLWLRHFEDLSKMVRREKQGFSAPNWVLGDLMALTELKGRMGEGPITRYGRMITLSTLEGYQHEIDEWARKSDSVVTLNGMQINLRLLNKDNWGVYLLRYDYCGGIQQRNETNGLPHRLRMISPPASTMTLANQTSNEYGADVPTLLRQSALGGTEISTKVFSWKTILQR